MKNTVKLIASKFINRTITRDLTLGLILIITTTLVSIGGLSYFFNTAQSENNLKAQARETADKLANILSVPLWTLDIQTVRNIAEAYQQAENVVGIRVLDEAGNIIYASSSDEDQLITARSPISYRERQIGDVEISLSTKAIRSLQNTIFVTTSTNVLLVVLVVLLATGFLLEISLNRPLGALTLGIDKVASGNYEHVLNHAPQTDIDEIVQRVNLMSSQIAERIKALHRERDIISRIMQTSPVGITMVDHNGQIIFSNSQARKILGEGTDQAAQISYNAHDSVSSILEGNLLFVENSLLLQVMSSAQPVYDVQHSVNLPNGKQVLLSINAAPLFNEVGQVDGMVTTIEDVTERRQAEISFLESEERYHSLFDRMRDGVYRSTHAGKFVDVNPVMVKMFGYASKAEMLEIDIKTELYFAPEERGTHKLDTGAGEIDVYRLRRKDGSEIWVEDRGTYVYDEQGRITHHEGIMRDVTQRVQAEEALAASEAKLRALVEQVPTTVYTESAETQKTLYISPQVEKLTGYTSAEWVEDHDLWKKVIHPADVDAVVEVDDRTQLTHEPFSVEYRILTRDGRTLWIHDEAVSIKNQDGTPLFWQGVMYDITERKQAGEALRESEAMLKRVQGVAHLGSWEIDLTTKTVTASDEAHRIYGIPQGSMTLAHVQSVPLTEFRPMLDEALTALIMEGKRYDVEFKLQRISDGEIRDIHSIAEYRASSQTIIGSVQDITERKQAEESIHQRVMELETLNRISLILRAVSKQEEMLTIVLDEALAILNTSHGSIELYNKTTECLDQTILRGWMAQLTAPHPISEGIAGKVFSNAETYITREFASDPETRAAARSQIPPGWGGICLPIRTSQQTLGVMNVSVPSERELDKDEIRLLAILSEMTGAALQRMQLHEQTVRRLEQLHALRAVDQAISSSRDMRLTLNILLTHTIAQLGVDAADVLLLHPGSNFLELAAGYGFHTLLFESVNLSDSIAGRAILEHRPIMMVDSETVTLRENPQFAEFWKEEGFACYWCVPLIVKGEVKGVLEVYRRMDFTPDAEWTEFLEALAGQAAIAIDSTQLFENLQRANLDLSLAYDATIEGWSQAMDLRDHETEGHTLRVTDLTLKLARAMRVSESQLTAIRRGALLHDIGKMGVPDAILLKEGNLTDEEWVLMRKHPQLAYDMLAPIAYLKDALEIPYCHHEKWDGTGYPQGLKEDRIPLVARIFAIVDVWDALTNDRTYRKKWTEQKTCQYIKEQSGKHFDPQVVNAFLKIIEKE